MKKKSKAWKEWDIDSPHLSSSSEESSEEEILKSLTPFQESQPSSCCCGGTTVGIPMNTFSSMDRHKILNAPPDKEQFYPILVIIFSLAHIVYMVVELVMNHGFDNHLWLNVKVQVLENLGGRNTLLILQGEFWRLFSATLLHAGVPHLVINLISQLFMGWKIERQVGSIKFLIIYVGSGFCGNILSAIFLPRVIEVGASSSICGLFAVYYVDLYLNWHNIQKRKGVLVVYFVGTIVTLGIGLLPLIDNFAHIGGILGGAFISMIMLPNRVKILLNKYEDIPVFRSEKSKRVRIAIGMAGLVIYLAGTIFLLYGHVDVENGCKWCEYFSCIPISEGWCPAVK